MYFLVNDFSRIHHDSLRDTISWKRFVKDDCVRSCLIELESFLLSKLDVNPIHSVLMFLPYFLFVPTPRASDADRNSIIATARPRRGVTKQGLVCHRFCSISPSQLASFATSK